MLLPVRVEGVETEMGANPVFEKRRPSPGGRRRGRLGRLWACREGASMLEFAFAAPVLVLAVTAVVELGMILFVTALLEGGVRDASRFGITGYAPAGVNREDRIVERITENALGLVDASDIDISTMVYGDFSQIGQPEPFVDSDPANGTYDTGEEYVDVNGNGQWDADMGVAGAGGPGSVVVYTASLDWPLVTPLMGALIGTDGKIGLSASIAVRNEPYPVPAGG